jgi:hypothetical protein
LSAVDASGIDVMGCGEVAWFRDPEVNAFAIEEEPK